MKELQRFYMARNFDGADRFLKRKSARLKMRSNTGSAVRTLFVQLQTEDRGTGRGIRRGMKEADFFGNCTE